MQRLRWVATLAIVAVFLSACSERRPVEPGTWTGFVTPPGMGRITSTYDVSFPDDSVQIMISVQGLDEDFPLQDVTLRDSSLSFWWEPLMRVDCELIEDDERVFRGHCVDPEGGIGPMVMAPPGVTPREVREEEAARVEAAKWAERAELDEIDGPRGGMYDVGETRLNALVEGEGPVSVVLISDFGDDLRTWDYVAHEVKDFARVVSYSRSGIGHSEESVDHKSFDQIAGELEMLLDEAEVDGPYVVVGHAFGAAFVQAFASRNAGDVAGVLLLDPVHPAIGERLRLVDAQSWDTYWSGQQTLSKLMPPPVRGEFELYRDVIDAGRLDGAGEMPDVPITVISSMRPPETSRWVGETEEGLEVKRKLHEELISGFSQGTHLVDDESRGYTQREHPDLVVDAIRQLAERAQAS